MYSYSGIRPIERNLRILMLMLITGRTNVIVVISGSERKTAILETQPREVKKGHKVEQNKYVPVDTNRFYDYVCATITTIIAWISTIGKKGKETLFIHGNNFKAVSLWGCVREMLVFGEKGKPGVPREKPHGAEWRTNKLSPHETSDRRTKPLPHLWEASALTTSACLLPGRPPLRQC